MKDLEKQLEIAVIEIERLKHENSQLKQRLADISNNNPDLIDISQPPASNDSLMIKDPNTKVKYVKGTIHNYSNPSEKIALFRSIFRGREDAYPNRWESKAGKSGYSPACKNGYAFIYIRKTPCNRLC